MQPRPTGSKSRPTARKRLNADDSPFIGPSAGAKRGGEKLEGVTEPRAKRKRVETQSGGSGIPGTLTKRTENASGDGELGLLTVDFHSLPVDALHRYLVQADAAPVLYPSPCSTENPPLPGSLLNIQMTLPRARRRSSRLQEEEARSRRAPILADAEAVHDVLATLSERHFEKQGIKEGDAVQQFLLAVRTRC
ncbi:hypothetical protein JB92DRAFT_3081097 [Gautieria morchelliformis]|nr:hypothetical protein JB92DRAFT_3081097 [Gautieria morchelliformis]